MKRHLARLVFVASFVLLVACAGVGGAGSAPASPTAAAPTAAATPLDPALLAGIQAKFTAGPHARAGECADCHATRGGQVTAELAWFNPDTRQAEPSASADDLCAHCHAAQAAADATAPLAHPQFGCTACHEPHTAQADCTQSGCHADLQLIRSANTKQPENHTGQGDPNSEMCGGSACHALVKEVAQAPVYHQPVHLAVPCAVCHDASGLAISRTLDGSWITLLGAPSAGADDEVATTSHLIAVAPDCTRCHRADNPWGLDAVPASQ